MQGVVRCPGLVFVTQGGRTIYDLRGEEHEDVNHRGESGQSENSCPYYAIIGYRTRTIEFREEEIDKE